MKILYIVIIAGVLIVAAAIGLIIMKASHVDEEATQPPVSDLGERNQFIMTFINQTSFGRSEISSTLDGVPPTGSTDSLAPGSTFANSESISTTLSHTPLHKVKQSTLYEETLVSGTVTSQTTSSTSLKETSRTISILKQLIDVSDDKTQKSTASKQSSQKSGSSQKKDSRQTNKVKKVERFTTKDCLVTIRRHRNICNTKIKCAQLSNNNKKGMNRRQKICLKCRPECPKDITEMFT